MALVNIALYCSKAEIRVPVVGQVDNGTTQFLVKFYPILIKITFL